MEFAQKQMTKLALAGVLLGMCGWFGHILSLHDDDARFTFSPHFQVLNAPLEFAWEHASPKYLNMAEVELPHRGHPGIVSTKITPDFPRAGSRAEHTLTDGSTALEVVDDRNDVSHVFRYSVYQTGFLSNFVFKLQGIWKFSLIDSSKSKWTFRFRLVPKNRLGNVFVLLLMQTWKSYQAEMIPDIRHQLQDMHRDHITSHGTPIPEWATTVDEIRVDHPLHNNHF